MDFLCNCIDFGIAIWMICKLCRVIHGLYVWVINFVEDRLERREMKKLTRLMRKRKYVQIKNTDEIVSTKNWVCVPEQE